MDLIKASAANKLKPFLFLFSFGFFFIVGNAQDCDCIYTTLQYTDYGPNPGKVEYIRICFPRNTPIEQGYATSERSGPPSRKEYYDWRTSHEALFEYGLIIKKKGDTTACLIDVGPYDEEPKYVAYKMSPEKRVKYIDIGKVKKIISPSGKFADVGMKKKAGWIWNND